VPGILPDPDTVARLVRDIRARRGFDPHVVQAVFEDPGLGVMPLVLVPRGRFTQLFGGEVTLDDCDGHRCGAPAHAPHARLVFRPAGDPDDARAVGIGLPLGDAAERAILARMARQAEVRFVMGLADGEPAQGGLMRVTFTGMGPRLLALLRAMGTRTGTP
jgi:hypothetical protein